MKKSIDYENSREQSKTLGEAKKPVAKKLPAKKTVASGKKPLGPEKIPTGGGQFIKNPAWLPTAKYEGDPAKFDFGAQKKNYDMLSTILTRNGKKFEYIGVAISGAGPDIFVATAPGVVWYKYVGNNPMSGQNYLYINGAKIKTSNLLFCDSAMQDQILTCDPAWVYFLIGKFQNYINVVSRTKDLKSLNDHKHEIIKHLLTKVSD